MHKFPFQLHTYYLFSIICALCNAIHALHFQPQNHAIYHEKSKHRKSLVGIKESCQNRNTQCTTTILSPHNNYNLSCRILKPSNTTWGLANPTVLYYNTKFFRVLHYPLILLQNVKKILEYRKIRKVSLGLFDEIFFQIRF